MGASEFERPAGTSRKSCASLLRIPSGPVPIGCFTVLVNTRALHHRDVHNLRSEPNIVLALSNFRGGEVWVETEGRKVPLEDKGVTRHSELLDPKLLDHSRVHTTMPW